MQCENCAKRVKEALESKEGIKKVKVDLTKNEAVISGQIDDNLIKNTISNIGYEVVEITDKKGLF